MIDEWIANAAREFGIDVVELPECEVDQLIRTIEERYVRLTARNCFLWEAFENSVSVRKVDGWKDLCEYCQQAPNLLYREDSRNSGRRLTSGSALKKLLSECPGFEFYVTDSTVEYVLCHNHHDYLIGVGRCVEWLGTLAGDSTPNVSSD